jgi:beta-lactamase regulating signal transducer with metallopeptidase domain
MALAVLLVQAALGPRLPAVWRHALWLPVLFVLGSPVLPESPLSLENRWSEAPVVTMPAGPIASDAVPTVPEAAPVVTPSTPAIDASQIAAGVWIAGIFATLLLGGVAWHRTLAAFHRRAVPLSPELLGEIRGAARSRGLRKMPDVLVSAAVPGPSMGGVFRPILLLPSSFAETFDRDERRLILLHEMTHVKRGDLIVNAIVFLLQAVHWCNPLVWFAFARLRADRELACDSVVLSMVDEDRRSVYGHALLKVETMAALPPRHLGFVGLVGLFGRGRSLRSRLSAISTHRGSHPVSTLAGLVLLLGLLFAGATRAQNDSKPSDAPQISIQAKLIETSATAKIEVHSDSVSFDEKTGTAVFSPDADFMETIGTGPGTDVLSAPSVVTVSGEKAAIEIGQQVPDATGGQRFAGVRLEILPTLRDGRIDLALDLRVTSQVPGSTPVAFEERSLQSKATVRPNEVVMVRGIEREPGTGGTDRHLYLLVSPGLIEPGLAGNAADSVARAEKGPEELRTRLGAIVIPELRLENATLSEALTFLAEKSRELDPAKQGVNIVHLPAPGEPAPQLTVDLRSIPLTEALRYVADLSGYVLEYGATAVTLRGIGTAPQAAANSPVPPADKTGGGSGRTGLAARLVLPEATFRNAPLPDVIRFLQEKSIELDPAKKGLNFILKINGEPRASEIDINLSLREIPLSEALRYVAQLGGLNLRFDENAVVLSRDPVTVPGVASSPAPTTVKVTGARTVGPAGGTPAPPAVNAGAPAGNPGLAARLVLPEATFRNAPLPDVIRFLQQKSIELDPAKKGLNFFLKLNGGRRASEIVITLSLREVPLSEALRYVAQLSGCELEYDSNSVTLRSPAPAPQAAATSPGAGEQKAPRTAEPRQELQKDGDAFITKAYAFPGNIHQKFVAESLEKNLKGAFMEKGVPFPDGTSIAWTPQSGGRLIVRNSANHLELVDALVENAVTGAGR